jgi:hypothetical protein
MLRSGSALAAALSALGCMEMSPFEVDLDADQRDKTAENLARLAAQPDPVGRWRFGLISDSHEAYDELAAIVDVLNARGDLELVLHGGDMSDVGLRREYVWTLDELERLDVPYLTVVGNHDGLGNGKLLYASMFGPEDYGFEHGGVAFVCFNSNEKQYPGTPRLEWLANALQQASGKPTVALTHAPPKSMERDYAPTIVGAGVDLALSGHLDGSDSYRLEDTLFFRVDSVVRGGFAVVSVGGGEPLLVEACDASGCGAAGGP